MSEPKISAGTTRKQQRGVLLSIIEFGGYPNLSDLYRQTGYEVVTVRSVRKGLTELKKKRQPSVIVAEFNYQSDFRDRTSSLESLLAAIQGISGIKVIVFYEHEYRHQLQRLQERFPIHATLPYPIDTQTLKRFLI